MNTAIELIRRSKTLFLYILIGVVYLFGVFSESTD